jgi:hypothetical protein
VPDIGAALYETKTVLILRRDLARLAVANVAAFWPAAGRPHGHSEGEPYGTGSDGPIPP